MMRACSRLAPRLAVGLMLALTPAVSSLAQPPAASAAAEDRDGVNIRVLLAPALETTLVSAMVGRVSAVNVGLGDRFRKGAVLVRFDCSEQRARLQMANAELASAREQHEAKLRLQGLQQAGEVEVAMAASAVARARAQVNLHAVQADQCVVAAPFDGRVVKVAVKPHQGVGQAQPLLEIISAGPLKLRLNAPARWVRWLRQGTPFEVMIDETGQRYAAEVSALNGRIDPVSQTIELEATLVGAAEDVLPGMSGSARFTPPDGPSPGH